MKKYIIFFILAVIACFLSIFLIRQTSCFVLQTIEYKKFNIQYPECLVPFVMDGQINFLKTNEKDGAIVFDVKYHGKLEAIENDLSSSTEYIDVKKNTFKMKNVKGNYVIFIKADRQSIAFIDMGSTKYTLGYVGKYDNFDYYLSLLSRFVITDVNKG